MFAVGPLGEYKALVLERGDIYARRDGITHGVQFKIREFVAGYSR